MNLSLLKAKLNSQNWSCDFYYRNSLADKSVLNQIFVNTDYSFTRLRRGIELTNYFNSIVQKRGKPLVVDAGANIGASVVWFHYTFTGAHIVAFEPDDENFKLLQMNAIGKNVDLRKAAIGCEDGRAEIINPGSSSVALRTAVKNDGACSLVSMSRITQEKIAAGYVPFIVKIDIEGGEDNLFSNSTEWVDQFPVLIIELHDWLFLKQKTSQTFLKTISQLDRDFVYIGENIFSIRNKI